MGTERAAECTEPCVNGNGNLETGGEPGPRHRAGKCNYKKHAVTLVILILLIVIALTVWVAKSPSAAPGPLAGPACPDCWVGFQRKCYYFSEAEGNWTNSRDNCSALGASLAGIDSLQEMAFLLRYKGVQDHWVGLRREQDQPWKWANGTEFGNLFEIRGGGACAYLNDENGASSSRCYMGRRWICSKLDAYVMGNDPALEKGLK
ncbi:C-type lectin domain family 2 member B-like [Pelodiscus sinensis]|uniref:C-type lectin domain family 2 member B-like n=1 Tax=Pelodiscus sinensis TaxID=13735 RepID=UPI003F6D3264